MRMKKYGFLTLVFCLVVGTPCFTPLAAQDVDTVPAIVEIYKAGRDKTGAAIWENTKPRFRKAGDPGMIGGWSDANAPDARRYLDMDVDGDGLADIVEIYKVAGNRTGATVWRNGDDGFRLMADPATIGAWSNVDAPDARRYRAMDVNGDGLADLVEIYKAAAGRTNATVWLSTGTGFRQSGNPSRIGGWTNVGAPDARRYLDMDANGDGLSDLVEIYRTARGTTNATTWQSTGRAFRQSGKPSHIGGWSDVGAPDARRYLAMDADGDRRMDIVEIHKAAGKKTNAVLWWNTGEGFIFAGASQIGGWSDVDAPNARRYLVMDADGDRLPDIVEIYAAAGRKTNATIWRNTGRGFVLAGYSVIGDWSDVDAPNARRYLVMHLDGNRLPALIEIYRAGDRKTNATVWQSTGEGFTFLTYSNIGNWSDLDARNARRYLIMDVPRDRD